MKLANNARRAISVALAAACFVVVPSIAGASFTDRSSVTVSVGTATVPAPVDVTGNYRCRWEWLVIDGVTVNIDTVQHAMSGKAGVTYQYALRRADGSRVITESGTPAKPAARLDDTKFIDASTSRWTLNVTASLFNWTGAPHQESIVCETGSTKRVDF
ncbi:hypothetical protein [Nocardioides ferulae]|uniref:hypothetical protein n=1 Tax=Nocardioides ferulae TaxID=2340821 RepID=UPI000EB29B94|nr:hypothetical protein [Nocardioides ferulae]